MFGTNSYLGLNFHPACIEASVKAARHFGTGSTASRVAAGNHRLHVMLERDIAAFYGRTDAVVFSTGFMANLGVISALARKGDVIFADAHCHASIFDACRLSGAQVETFSHNDSGDLERLFATSKVPGPQTLVVCEGLYSVRGDLGDLNGLTAFARRHGAVVLVDEAHSLGIYGRNGRGIAEHLGVEADVDVIVGTFSKSIGGIGGYAVSSSSALRALRFMSRSYLYTASLPPPTVVAAREAVRLIKTQPRLREDLWRNATALHAGLTAIGVQPCAEPGPVGCIRMAGLSAGYQFWKALLDRGIYVYLLLPPSTPDGEVVLRFSVSAAHTPDHIKMAIDAAAEVSKLLATA
ncbi:8-amino-7-oxononanoate synthase [mine drainage metagenome]|uniref:8-amino-7-oxononanoate synthase n=1 Tax=mine drainage metagenome TaxID=410659 RepID=A0A1J5NZY5_9ZZZZ